MEKAFEIFWAAYPRRIAKGAARKAFAIALRKTTLEIMLAAIEQYKRHKPEKIDYCHAATWLNGERWEDQWEDAPTVKPQPVVRAARSLDELRKYLKSIGKPVRIEIEKARDISDLPAFMAMVPVTWQQH